MCAVPNLYVYLLVSAYLVGSVKTDGVSETRTQICSVTLRKLIYLRPPGEVIHFTHTAVVYIQTLRSRDRLAVLQPLENELKFEFNEAMCFS